MLSEVTNQRMATILEQHDAVGCLNLWDVGVNASPHIHAGDTLYIRVESRLYVGTVVEKIDDPSGQTGDCECVRWKRMFGAPWRYPLLFADLRQLTIVPISMEERFSRRTQLTKKFYRIRD